MAPEELVARNREDRAAFAALWEGLSEEEMARRPGPQHDWSVKDLIAHVTFWEQFAMERIADALAGREPDWVRDYDAVNAEVWQRHKDDALADVLAAFAASEPQVEAQILSLTDEQLHDGESYPTRGTPLFDIYAGNRFGHYAEHEGDLRRYVEGLGKRPETGVAGD
jgi:hypothetical protein